MVFTCTIQFADCFILLALLHQRIIAISVKRHCEYTKRMNAFMKKPGEDGVNQQEGLNGAGAKAAGGDVARRPVPILPQTVLEGIGNVEQAISKQTLWFKTWYEQAVCCRDVSSFRIRKVEDIPLGAWYASSESAPFRNNPGFLTLGEKLQEIVSEVQVFVAETDAGGPHPVDEYGQFMNSLLDLNSQIQHLQNDAWRGLTKMDPLTGVRNRHDMMLDLDHERERSRRTEDPCVVAMVDLDFFKSLNDTHGHIVGDQVLRHVAQLLAEQLRPYDRIYRYGGEEFLLCLPNTDQDTAQRVLNRLREKIARSTIVSHGVDGDGNKSEGVSITASFGAAELDTVEHVVKTIERADMALYDVKQSGRNAVKVWNDVSEASQ